MKKGISILLSLFLLIPLFTGCNPSSGGAVNDAPGGEKETQGQIADNTQGQEDNTSTNTQEEKQTLWALLRDVSVKCDANRRVRDEGVTTLIYKDSFSVVGFCVDFLETYENLALEDVLGVFEERFPGAASVVSEGALHNEKIQVLETKKVTVAGFESIQFTGTVHNKSGWECHVYGYTFVIDDTPYAVIGLVSQKEQSADLIAENKAEVDEIAASIKNGF